MKELKTMPKKDDFDFSKVLKKVIIALVAVVVFIVLLAAGQIVFLLQIFGWLANQVRSVTGLDMMLVNGITAILMSLILILPIGGFILSFFPVPVKNKNIKRFSILGVFAVLCFVSYFSSKNVFFDPATGEPLKYYSISPSGEYKFYSSDGYDPLTGDKLKTINKEVILKHLENSKGTKNGLTSSNDNFGNSTNNEIILTGAEKYANFYPVEFANETERNIFLCVSLRNDPMGAIKIMSIPAGEKTSLSLIEGRHIFAYMDANGYMYGKRDWGSILSATNLNNEPVSLRVNLDNKEYELTKTYYLEVLPKDKQVVTLEVDNIQHSEETKVPDIIKGIGVMLLFIIMIFFVAACLSSGAAASSTVANANSNSYTNPNRTRSY